MATEIRVPALGESITEATVTTWLKGLGDAVAVDEPILELEIVIPKWVDTKTPLTHTLMQ